MGVAEFQDHSGQSLSAQPVRRAILKSMGFLFAGALLAISATMNWHFGTTLGKTEVEQQLFGVASLAVDGLKAVLPLFVIFLWKASHRFMCAVALLLWLLCFSWSMASAIGFSASSREMAQAERSGAVERREANATRQAEIRSQLATLPSHRARNVVASELETVDVPVPVMRRTHGCTDFTREDSRQACEPALKLRRELAVAEQSEKLEGELKDVAGALYETAGSVSVADPQVYTLSKLTSLSVDQIKVGLSLLIAVLVELASAFGFTLVALATSRDTLQRIELRSMISAENERLRAQVRNARLVRAVEKERASISGPKTAEADTPPASDDAPHHREPQQAALNVSPERPRQPVPAPVREVLRNGSPAASVRSTPHQVEGIARQATNGFSWPQDLALPSSKW